MKKIVGILLAVSCAILCIACVSRTNSDAKATIAQSESFYVYVCTGKYAKRYHRYVECRGLQKCQSNIVKMTQSDAEKQGRTPCALCY